MLVGPSGFVIQIPDSTHYRAECRGAICMLCLNALPIRLATEDSKLGASRHLIKGSRHVFC
jgi:hypothetical protein